MRAFLKSALIALVAIVIAGAARAHGPDCVVQVENAWFGSRVEATAVRVGGNLCSGAEVTLAVLKPDGTVRWTSAHRQSELFGFEEAVDSVRMEKALTKWITDGAWIGSAATLPVWREGAAAPEADGAFPFAVNFDVGRAAYEAARTGDYPMICYVQGRKSKLCLVEAPSQGRLIAIGAQNFPA